MSVDKKLWMLFAIPVITHQGLLYAQDAYPSKPIRIITSGVGSGSDFVARQIAEGISGPLGQPVVVENRGSVQGPFLMTAPPDGYNLAVAGGGNWVRPLLEKTDYQPLTDYAHISLASREVFVVAVHPSLPVHSVKELVALAKARPGQLNYGMNRIGSSSNLTVELFKAMADVDIVGVPYKAGNAAATAALIAGEVQVVISDAGLLMPHVKSGRVRVLAVSSAEPSPLTPGLPTVSASGLPGYDATGLTAVFAPAKTPAAIVERLNQEIVRTLNNPEVKERFFKKGSEVVTSSPAELTAILKDDIAKWAKVIKSAGIKTN